MATAAAVERFKAAGKVQLNVWVDSDIAAILKTLSVQRSQSYGDVIRDALVSLHSGQPVAPATPVAGNDSIDRLSLAVTGLSDDLASVRSIIGDWSSAFESRLSDLQDSLEARLSAVEAAINTTPVLSIPVPQATPVSAAPGANEAADKRKYGKASNVEIKKRRERMVALHHQGLSTTGISKSLQAEGFMVGTSAGEADKYLRSQGLIPHSSRK